MSFYATIVSKTNDTITIERELSCGCKTKDEAVAHAVSILAEMRAEKMFQEKFLVWIHEGSLDQTLLCLNDESFSEWRDTLTHERELELEEVEREALADFETAFESCKENPTNSEIDELNSLAHEFREARNAVDKFHVNPIPEGWLDAWTPPPGDEPVSVSSETSPKEMVNRIMGQIYPPYGGEPRTAMDSITAQASKGGHPDLDHTGRCGDPTCPECYGGL